MVSLKDYHDGMSKYRAEFHEKNAFGPLLKSDDKREILSFFIYFSGLGIKMTEPVEDWIERAGKKCKEIGLEKIGKKLERHAAQEAGHHNMMIEDLEALSLYWNEFNSVKIQPDEVRKITTDGILKYGQVHEDTIENKPFGQVSIEYEIELLSLKYGSDIVNHFRKKLGWESSKGLSFLEDHIELDVGHTKFNEKLLNDVLTLNSGYLDDLIISGNEALSSYCLFTNNCLEFAKDLCSKAEKGT